jgi:flagellar hook-length control protein FliK
MMHMDVSLGAALSAAPPPDASCGCAESPAGAADVFAAILDKVAGTTGEPSVPATDGGKESADEKDPFDELAAMAMTSLLSLGGPVAPPQEVVNDEEVATDTDVVDETAIVGVGSPAVLVDPARQSQMTPSIPDADSTPNEVADIEGASTPAPVPPMWDGPMAEGGVRSTETNVEKKDDGVAFETVAEATVSTETAEGDVSAAMAQGEVVTSPVKARGAKPSRVEKAARAHGHHADAPVDMSLPSVATKETPAASTARAIAAAQSVKEPQATTLTAARFARALERAAALTTNEAGSQAAAAVSTDNGTGQQSASGDGSADRAMLPFAAARHGAAPSVSFTLAVPTAIDARTLARAVDAASQATESASVTIPERDVVAQLVQSMRVQFRDGIGEAVVKLKPEHLGSVQVSLKIENGTVKATVQAEVAAVRQWLESQQETLKASLADQGLRLERFVVERPVVDRDGERHQAREDDAQRREHRRRHEQRRMSVKDQPVFEVTV